MILRLGRRTEAPEVAAARERIRPWTREALGGDPALSFTVSEIACGGVETIVLVMADGRRTEALEVPGAMLAIGWPDVLDAVSRRPDLWPPLRRPGAALRSAARWCA